MKLLIQLLLILLTIPIHAMELAKCSQQGQTIPSLKDLCLPVALRIIENNYQRSYETLHNIMQQIPQDLHQPIISAFNTLAPDDFNHKEKCLAISSDHDYACLANDEKLSILGIRENKLIAKIPCSGHIESALFSDGKPYIAYITPDRQSFTAQLLHIGTLTTRVNNIIDMTNEKFFTFDNTSLRLQAFNNSTLLATDLFATDNDHLWIYDYETDQNLRKYDIKRIDRAIFCNNNTIAYTNWHNQNINLFNIDSGNNIRTIEHPNIFIHSLKAYNDNITLLLASVSEDQKARIWDTDKPEGEECIATLEHSSPVFALCFNPSGQLIATGGKNSIYLWEINSKQCIASYTYDTNNTLINFIFWTRDNAIISNRRRSKETSIISRLKVPYIILGHYLATLSNSEQKKLM